MSEEKCCCCKEPIGTIPIIRIIDKLDMLFAKNEMAEAGRLLEYWESEARTLGDNRGLSEILSEEIGYYRSTGDKDKGLRAVEEELGLLECMDSADSVSNATIYLNCATTLKAFGKVEEALPYYEKARDTYERLLPSDDFRLAGFYNNYAAAMSELLRFDKGEECYKKAIEILKSKGGYCELAVSYVNLAQLVYDRSQENGEACDDEIEELLELAYDCLNDEGLTRDGNYAKTCEKCVDAFGFFGYFIQKQELESRAKEIYDSNRK